MDNQGSDLAVAPRAGFEPATNRLTVVFHRYCLPYGASICTAQVLVDWLHLVQNAFRVMAGYCA
jgi:hypothetical protein